MWIYSGGECVEFVGEDEEVTKAMIEEWSEMQNTTMRTHNRIHVKHGAKLTLIEWRDLVFEEFRRHAIATSVQRLPIIIFLLRYMTKYSLIHHTKNLCTFFLLPSFDFHFNEFSGPSYRYALVSNLVQI